MERGKKGSGQITKADEPSRKACWKKYPSKNLCIRHLNAKQRKEHTGNAPSSVYM